MNLHAQLLLLLFASAPWAGQARPPQIGSSAYFAAQEGAVAQKPDDQAARSELITSYYDYGKNSGLPIARVLEARRQHIAWMIMHHAEAAVLADYRSAIAPSGSYLADAQGYAEIGKLWREQIAAPGATAATIVNAASFFRISDRAAAFAMSDRIWPSRQNDASVANLRAALDVLEIMGASEFNNPADIIGKASAFSSERGLRARKELNDSTNVKLLAAAGHMVSRFAHVTYTDLANGPDVWAEATQWLERARGIEPGNKDVARDLMSVIQRRALVSSDRNGRVALLRKALDIAPGESEMVSILFQLANADLEAADLTSAEADARRLLALSEKQPESMQKFFSDQARRILEQVREKTPAK